MIAKCDRSHRTAFTALERSPSRNKQRAVVVGTREVKTCCPSICSGWGNWPRVQRRIAIPSRSCLVASRERLQVDLGIRRQHKGEDAAVEHVGARLAIAEERLGQGSEVVPRLEVKIHLRLEPALQLTHLTHPLLSGAGRLGRSGHGLEFDPGSRWVPDRTRRQRQRGKRRECLPPAPRSGSDIYLRRLPPRAVICVKPEEEDGAAGHGVPTLFVNRIAGSAKRWYVTFESSAG